MKKLALILFIIAAVLILGLYMKPKSETKEEKEITKETFITYPTPPEENKNQEEGSGEEKSLVSKIGVVEILAANIYQQGTHILREDQDNFILLESKSIDLNQYLLKKVKVSGSLSPTIEGGKQIMAVEKIEPI